MANDLNEQLIVTGIEHRKHNLNLFLDHLGHLALAILDYHITKEDHICLLIKTDILLQVIR